MPLFERSGSGEEEWVGPALELFGPPAEAIADLGRGR
jgi:hypothetical protein